MPTSRSRKQAAEPSATAAGSRFYWPFILIAALAALTVAVIALPASMVKHFLPPSVGAEDFSGSLWHGSAGKLTVNGRDVGAVEWHLHPLSLLHSTLSVDLHWVKVGFVADGVADVTAHSLTLRNVEGDGPIEDLRDFGLAPGWHGTASFKVRELKVIFAKGTAGAGTAGNGPMTLVSAVGDLNVLDVASPQVADGADLGGYLLHMANVAIAPGAAATAELSDTGGPLEVSATVNFSADGRTGMLSGSVKARSDAAPALRNELENLAQLHARDAQGAIPVDFEFTF